MRHIALGLGMAVGLVLAPLAASANAPPPLGWCGEAGDTCRAVDGTSAGVCTKKRCSRPTPNGKMEYDCVVCVPVQIDKTKDKPKK